MAIIQTLSFVLIGNQILEIKGMWLRYFAILFTAACWANLIGLNISSGFNSIVTIYIILPLILIPQILFSGVVVDFNHMHKKIMTEKYVPFIGDMITSRWAYEALVVTQFKDNAYEKHLFGTEEKLNSISYARSYQLPYLRGLAYEAYNLKVNAKKLPVIDKDLSIISNEIYKIEHVHNQKFDEVGWLNIDRYDDKVFQSLSNYFEAFETYLSTQYHQEMKNKDKIYEQIEDQFHNRLALYQIKERYYNDYLAFLVLNRKELMEHQEINNELVRLKDNIYREPASNIGRAHYFSPHKTLGQLKVDTFWFNMLIIWLFTFVFYVLLYFDVLRKLISYVESIRLVRLNNRVRRVLTQ
ncbi:MAG: hypothetical protein HC896_02890 [Bacteroidales bacterium]|nr:hypothetical protein [Bacteroidales bacterium]